MDRTHILVVDDEPIARIILKKMLTREGYEVSTVESGEEGLRFLRQNLPDLILMDIIMPAGLDGRQTIQAMKEREGERMPPYIYLTIDPDQEREGLEDGADDYIFKGNLNPDKLQIIKLRIKNNLLIRSLSFVDGLTGLYNHTHFQISLKRAFAEATRFGEHLSVVIGDLDNFKSINDQHGHQYGDKILVEVAMVLKQISRSSDVVARYGGDEYAVILPKTDLAGGLDLTERIRVMVESAHFEGQYEPITMSFGIATYFKNNFSDQDNLLKSADEFMYLSKRRGKNLVNGKHYEGVEQNNPASDSSEII